MAMLVGHWHLRGLGAWAVEERASEFLVGRVGFYYPDGWPERELAWALARPYWDRGFALEAARAALAHAFGKLGWERIISLIDSESYRSVRLAERLGERFEQEVVILGQRLRLYSINRQAWAADS